MGLTVELDDLVVGDDYDIERDVLDVPDQSVLEKGWLTVKNSEYDGDADKLIQKEITSVEASEVGVISDVGESGTGTVFFQLTAAETELLTPYRRYHYDIQVRTDTGKIYTVEKGILVPIGQVTRASS